MALDQDKLMDFVHRFVGDLGATMTAGNVVVGHQTGLYKGLATGGPATGDELCGPIAATLAELGQRPGRQRSLATPGGLSEREVEVMRLVAMGRTSRQVATELFLSPRTVEMHVQNSMAKLGCRTRAEAVRHLAELGLTSGGGGTVRT